MPLGFIFDLVCLLSWCLDSGGRYCESGGSEPLHECFLDACTALGVCRDTSSSVAMAHKIPPWMFLPYDFRPHHPIESWLPWWQVQDELDFMCHVCKKPPCTRSSATTRFLAVFSEYVDIQKCLLKQLFDQPHQLALPFSNKTASFYSLLKIAISFNAWGHGDSCGGEEEERLFLLL